MEVPCCFIPTGTNRLPNHFMPIEEQWGQIEYKFINVGFHFPNISI